MSLHIETSGHGAPLLLIHGWGMHGGIWGDAAQQLARQHQVHSVDLPGHGASTPLLKHDLDHLVHALAARFDMPLTLCGWSLGGQIALRWAHLHPAQVEKLVLVATTPCFVQRADWPCALTAEVVQGFAHSMTQDHALTLKRFLALQVRGSDDERGLLQKLRAQLGSREQPDRAALQGGLDILRDTDLRAGLPDVRQAVLVIAGVRDTLVPLAAAEYLAQALPHARLATIAGAAHTSFLSHPQIFVEHMTSFLHERI